MCLLTATLRMIYKFITSYYQNNDSNETQHLGKVKVSVSQPCLTLWDPTDCNLWEEDPHSISTSISVSTMWWNTKWMRTSQGSWDRERLRTQITHMPSAMVWAGSSGGPKDGGEEKTVDNKEMTLNVKPVSRVSVKRFPPMPSIWIGRKTSCGWKVWGNQKGCSNSFM